MPPPSPRPSAGHPAGGAAPFRNRLLAGLPAEEIERLRPLLAWVTLVTNQVLHERGSRIEELFFPEDGIASLTADTSDNGSVEVGMTGREGVVGVLALLSPDAVAVHHAMVQVPGSGWRMRAEALRGAAAEQRFPTLRDRCMRYVQVVVVHNAQCAACNARHGVLERLARWLLMVSDRLDGDELPLRQEFLAVMLGVRRAGVNVAASTLQSAGLIGLSRGRVKVLDRAGLEGASCDCYRVIQDVHAKALGPNN